MRTKVFGSLGVVFLAAIVVSAQGQGAPPGHARAGRTLFESETFGGNGRTCRTCHSPRPARCRRRMRRSCCEQHPDDPLFLHDGSDDGQGHGVTRMLTDATVLVTHPAARERQPGRRSDGEVRRRCAAASRPTLNTPALDPVLMLDGRQPNLEAQAAGAIRDHAQAAMPDGSRTARRSRSSRRPTPSSAHRSSAASRSAARRRRCRWATPRPRSAAAASSRMCRPIPTAGLKPGLCAHCHSGPLLNRPTSSPPFFVGAPIPAGQRFSALPSRSSTPPTTRSASSSSTRERRARRICSAPIRAAH